MSNSNENITPAALLEQLVYVDTFMPEIDDPSQLDERLTAELSAFADESFIFPDEEKPARSSNNNSNNDEKNGHESHDDSTKVKEEQVNSHEHLIKRFNEMNQRFAGNPLQSLDQPKTFNTLQQTNNLDSGISNILSPLQHNHTNNQNNTTAPTPDAESLINHFSNGNGNGDNNNDILNNLPKVPVPPGAQSSLIAAGLSQTQIDALAALIAQHQGVDEHGNPTSSNSNLISPSQSLLNPVSTPSSSSDLLLGGHGNGSVSGSGDHGHGSGNLDSEGGFGGSHSRSNSIIKLENTGDVDIDKRRRNTAASARFRIKKKLKEQQLERNVRELNELTITLEKKIQTLEMENKLLRNLVVEKGEQKNNDELEYLKKKAKLAILDNNSTNDSNSNQNNNNSNGEFGAASGTF